MKTLLTMLLIGFNCLTAKVFAQANEKLLFVGADVLRGVGRYNGLGTGLGLNARLHYPLMPNLALTAKVGVEYYKIRSFGYMPSTYIGYGYNVVTGWGYNTIYSGAGSIYYEQASGVNVPIVIGPRFYLPAIKNGVHADLNVGADLAVTKTMLTVFHVSPGVGITLPMANNKSLDVMAYYFTSFMRGSGVVGVGVAYGLPVKF